MKGPVILLLGLMMACAPVRSGAEAPPRDYWPTRAWRTTSPGEQGVDGETLEQMDARVRASIPGATSILLVRHGYLVFEKYYDGGRDDLRDVACVTKAVVSALVGIALQKGDLQSLDQKMHGFFPAQKSGSVHPSVAEITIRHLLTMTSGFGRDFSAPGPEFEAVLFKRPLANPAGTVFDYCGTDSTLIAMILQKATGLNPSEYARKCLFRPLGISEFTWTESNGCAHGAFGLALSSRDMAKIGSLYLNCGKWGSKQILPCEWVSESTRKQVDFSGNPTYEDWADYGYYWGSEDLRGHRAFFAFGAGGQYIVVIPDLDTVFVTTGSMKAAQESLFGLVEHFVIPAVTGP